MAGFEHASVRAAARAVGTLRPFPSKHHRDIIIINMSYQKGQLYIGFALLVSVDTQPIIGVLCSDQLEA